MTFEAFIAANFPLATRGEKIAYRRVWDAARSEMTTPSQPTATSPRTSAKSAEPPAVTVRKRPKPRRKADEE